MFNRQLEVKVVKGGASSNTTSAKDDAELEAKVAMVTKAVEHGIRRIGMVIFGYVVLDTVRQVVVASRK